MKMKKNNIICPMCGKPHIFIGVHDAEGNFKGGVAGSCDYELDPWSGLAYGLHHEGYGDCILCTDGAESAMGGMLFDSVEKALAVLPAAPEKYNSETNNALREKLKRFIGDKQIVISRYSASLDTVCVESELSYEVILDAEIYTYTTKGVRNDDTSLAELLLKYQGKPLAITQNGDDIELQCVEDDKSEVVLTTARHDIVARLDLDVE